jgi:hypothetical protein
MEKEEENGLPKVHEWNWKTFEKVARDCSEKLEKAGKEPLTASELFMQMQLNARVESLKGYAAYYMRQGEHEKEQIAQYRKMGRDDEADKIERSMKSQLALAAGQQQQARQIEEERSRMKDISKFALQRATESYAELGIAAMQETHDSQERKNKVTQAIHVGPEMGWPTYFGSHPDEFVQLIRESRKVMAEKLQKDQNMDEATAEDEARRHIKGVLDTSHLGMFFQHFMQEEPSQDKRIKEFNKWFLKEINKIAEINAKEDILGNVQIVNSMSGAHGHLPPGQGIFEVEKAAEILVEKGNYKGYLTSEGHEEEKFQSGRILIDAWKSFDPNIMSSAGYGAGARGLRWTDVHQGYFGRPYSPAFIFGEYSPSQEFKLWSEVPLE